MSDLKGETGSKEFRFRVFEISVRCLNYPATCRIWRVKPAQSGSGFESLASRFGVSTIPRHVKFEGEITQNRSDSESVSERTEIEYQTSDTRGKFRDSLLDGGDRPGTNIQGEIASIYHMWIGYFFDCQVEMVRGVTLAQIPRDKPAIKYPATRLDHDFWGLRQILDLGPIITSGFLFLWDSLLDTGTLKTMIWTGAPVPRESGPVVNWCDV